MNLDKLRTYCLSLPHATEGVQWGDNLLFRVANKMFAVSCLDSAAPHKLSFKCTPEEFGELIERPGIVPAPYMARNHWVALDEFDALADGEIRTLVKKSYDLVVGNLTKKLQRELGATPASPVKARKTKRRI